MKFSTLFKVIDKDVEMEVYDENPKRYICSVSSCSRVLGGIWHSEVVRITPMTSKKVIVVMRREQRV